MAHIKINPVSIIGEPLVPSPIKAWITKVFAGPQTDVVDEITLRTFPFTPDTYPDGFESVQHAQDVAHAVAIAADAYAVTLRNKGIYHYVSKVRTEI